MSCYRRLGKFLVTVLAILESFNSHRCATNPAIYEKHGLWALSQKDSGKLLAIGNWPSAFPKSPGFRDHVGCFRIALSNVSPGQI